MKIEHIIIFLLICTNLYTLYLLSLPIEGNIVIEKTSLGSEFVYKGNKYIPTPYIVEDTSKIISTGDFVNGNEIFVNKSKPYDLNETFVRNEEGNYTMWVIKKDCVLSLCDCTCYVKGESPEDKGRICNLNCGVYNIIGCEYKFGKCVTIQEPESKCITKDDCKLLNCANLTLCARVGCNANGCVSKPSICEDFYKPGYACFCEDGKCKLAK